MKQLNHWQCGARVRFLWKDIGKIDIDLNLKGHAAEMQEALDDTSHDLSDLGLDIEQGFSIENAVAVLNAVNGGTNDQLSEWSDANEARVVALAYQTMLDYLGYSLNTYKRDGWFGPGGETYAALEEFYADYVSKPITGWLPDGKPGWPGPKMTNNLLLAYDMEKVSIDNKKAAELARQKAEAAEKKRLADLAKNNKKTEVAGTKEIPAATVKKYVDHVVDQILEHRYDVDWNQDVFIHYPGSWGIDRNEDVYITDKKGDEHLVLKDIVDDAAVDAMLTKNKDSIKAQVEELKPHLSGLNMLKYTQTQFAGKNYRQIVNTLDSMTDLTLDKMNKTTLIANLHISNLIPVLTKFSPNLQNLDMRGIKNSTSLPLSFPIHKLHTLGINARLVDGFNKLNQSILEAAFEKKLPIDILWNDSGNITYSQTYIIYDNGTYLLNYDLDL